jgi:TonB family protein
MKRFGNRPPCKRRIFYWTLGGHGLILLILVFGGLISSCSRPKKAIPHVFTLVTAPSPQAVSAAPKPATAIPKAKPEPTKPQPQPKPAQTQPKTQETPAPKPKPVVTPPKNQNTQPKPKPTPKPTEKKPEPKLQSYESFLQSQAQPNQPQPKPAQPKPQPQADPKNKLIEELQGLMREVPTHGPAASSEETRALNAYIGSLRSLIDQLWEQPENLPPGEWLASIQFTVSSNGQITQVRFIQRSGNTTFDQSIIRAMNQFRSAPIPPGGKTRTFEIPFRMLVQ